MTITGTRLAGAERLTFDNAQLSATILPGGNDSSLSARVDASSTAPVGSNAFTLQVAAGAVRSTTGIEVIAQQPILTSVSPSTLYTTQSNVSVTVTGTNFLPQSTVLLNNIAIATTFVNSTTLTAVVPAQAAGVKSLTVRTPDSLNAGLFFVSNAIDLNVQVPAFAFSPPSLTLAVGASGSLTLSIPYAAPAGGVTANLSANSAIVSVPATATIPAGASSVSVAVNAVTTTGGSTTVTASLSGFNTGFATASVTAPPSLSLPNTSLVSAGLSRNLTLSLSIPAPASGLNVALASSNTGVVTVPNSAVIPAGQTSVTIALTAVANGSATVTASAQGFLAGTTTVTVASVSVTMSLLNANSFSNTIAVAESQAATFQVRLSNPAPVGGLSFDLTSGNTSLVTLAPTRVTFSAGSISANETVAITGVARGSTTLTASSSGLSNSVLTISTTARTQLRFNPTTIWVGKGMRTNAGRVCRMLDGVDNAAPTALTVNLTSTDTTKATAPASVIIPAGSACAQFSHTIGLDLTTNGPATVSATATGYQPPADDLQVNVVTPTLQINNLSGSRNTLSVRDDFDVRFFVQNALYSNYFGNTTFDNRLQELAATTTINVSVTGGSPAGIADIFETPTSTVPITQKSLPAGISSATFYVGRPTDAGSYRVTVSITGVASAISAVQTVRSAANAKLVFDTASTAVAKGFRTSNSEIVVQRTFEDGTPLFDADPITVTITSSDPTKATVPSSVSIPTNSASAFFGITGVEFTGATPIVIDASVAGYASPTPKVSVSVVPPQFEFSGLELQRSMQALSRNSFILRVKVPGSVNPFAQAPTSQKTISLSVTDANPSGIVQLFNSATGSSVVTQLTLCSSECGSVGPIFVGEPSGPGSYTLTAAIAGLTTVKSPVVTVSTVLARLAFTPTTARVGVGLTSSEVLITRTAYPGTNYSYPALTVNVANSDPSRVSAPATVTFAAGQTDMLFSFAGLSVTGSQPVTFTASAPDLDPTVPLAVTVLQPSLVIENLDGVRFVNGPTDNFCITTFVPGDVPANSRTGQVPVSPLAISLAVTNETSPESVSIKNGSGQTIFGTTLSSFNQCDLSVSAPNRTGTYTITASASGYGSVTSPLQTAINPGTLVFSRTTIDVGKDTKAINGVMIVRQAVSGASISFSSPLVVTLTSSDSSKVQLPATVTIPTSRTSIEVPITGVDVTGDVPVTVTARATNFDPTATPLLVNVIESQFGISGPSGGQSTGIATRDSFSLLLRSPPGGAGSYSAAVPITLDLVAVDIGTNLAAPGTAQASSTRPFFCNSDGCEHASDPPYVVITGPQSGAFFSTGSGSFSTGLDLHPWWEVDLGSNQSINRIDVDFGPFGRRRAAILLASQPFVAGDFTSSTLPTTFSNGAVLIRQTTGLETSGSVAISGSFTGRYLRIVASGSDSDSLRLRNVRVFQGGGGPSNVVAFYGSGTGGNPISQTTIPVQTSGVQVFVGQPTAAGYYVVKARRNGVDVAESTSQNAHTPVAQLGMQYNDALGAGLSGELAITRLLDFGDGSSNGNLIVNVQCANTTICSVAPTTLELTQGVETFASAILFGKSVGATDILLSAVGYPTTRWPVAVFPSGFIFNVSSIPQGQSQWSLSAGFKPTGANFFSFQNVATDTTVSLVSSNPNVLQLPASVVIPAQTGDFPVILNGVASGSATVTLSAAGFTPLTLTITVQ